MMGQCPSPRQNKNFASTSKKVPKNSNQTPPEPLDHPRNPEPIPNTPQLIAVPGRILIQSADRTQYAQLSPAIKDSHDALESAHAPQTFYKLIGNLHVQTKWKMENIKTRKTF